MEVSSLSRTMPLRVLFGITDVYRKFSKDIRCQYD